MSLRNRHVSRARFTFRLTKKFVNERKMGKKVRVTGRGKEVEEEDREEGVTSR